MRKILLYLVAILTPFIFINNVKAWVKIDNNEFTNNYPLLYFTNGSHLFEYGGIELPALDPYKSTYNSYHVFMFCYNGESITEFDQYNSGGSPNGTTSTKWSVINSNNVCIYTPGGATGKIVYILAHNQYNSQLTSTSSVMQGKFNFKIPGSGSTVWYFISDFHDLKPITFDYTTNTIIAQNEDIKTKLDSLLNWQNAIYTAIVNSDTKLNNINQNLNEQKEQFKEQIQNQQETNDKLDEQMEQNQQQHQETIDTLTNSDAPDGMDSLGSASGWLPPGPVDSLLTLPLSMLNNISTSLGSTCKPINLPIPFVNDNLTMPCLNTIYSQISGLGVFLNSIGTIAAGFMLYYYFKKLYAYIDNLLSLKNNGEGWGDV